MKRESNGKVRELFLIAADLTAEDRTDFLDRECRSNPKLRRKLERLLEAKERTSSGASPSPRLAIISGSSPNNNSENEPTRFMSDESAIPAGKRIKRYRIIALIGKGGMGDVYLADDLSLDRKVALKVLNKELADDEERLKRFVHEAKAASSLNHPNIITVHEIDNYEEFMYIVSEYVDGKTLGQVISDDGISLRETAEIAKQIASALYEAHKTGIIHRDIKPQNVMQRGDGLIKVLDFGLAKTRVSMSGSKIDSEGNTLEKISTIPGLVLGTPNYMSPEQARGKAIDHKTDIFSFGVLLYELLTGHLPFQGENGMATIASILHKEPEPIENFLDHPPVDLVEIITRALQKNPKDRQEDMGEILDDLDAILEDLPLESKGHYRTGGRSARTTARNTVSIWIAGHLGILAAPVGLSVLLAFALLSWWYLTGYRGEAIDSLSEQLETLEVANWPTASGELLSTGSFSPDGRLIAYGSTKSGTLSIWVAQTHSGESIQITEGEFYDRFPIWSPTAEDLAFYSMRGGNPGIWRVSALGGQLKQIAQIKDAESRPKKWSAKGNIFYQGKYNLFSLDSETGASKQITSFAEEGIPPKVIEVSPDETRLAIVLKEGQEWKIRIQNLDDTKIGEIAHSADMITAVIWHPDGNRLYFNKSIEGVHQIFSTNLEGTSPLLLSESQTDSHLNDISADGKMLLFTSAKENSDIWKVDVVSAKRTILTPELDSELWANVSPDNQQIAYQSIKNLSRGNALTSGKIMVAAIEAAGRPRVVSTGFSPVWSPDGQNLAFLKMEGSSYEIWIVDKAGGRAKPLSKKGVQGVEYSMAPYNQTQPKQIEWSNDGGSLVYPAVSANVVNMRIVDADGGSDRSLTTNKDKNLRLLCPILSADEKFLAFASKTRVRNKNGDRLYGAWLHDIDAGKSTRLFESTDDVRLLGFSGSQTIIAAHAKPGKGFNQIPPEVDIYELSLTGTRKKLVKTLRDVYFFNIHLSPDSRNLAFVKRFENKDEMWVESLAAEDGRKLVANDDPRVFLSSLAWSPDAKSIIYDRQTRFSLLLLLTGGPDKGLTNE